MTAVDPWFEVSLASDLQVSDHTDFEIRKFKFDSAFIRVPPRISSLLRGYFDFFQRWKTEFQHLSPFLLGKLQYHILNIKL